MFLFVSSLRSVDSPGLFLALVVCGDGHCWCRVHGCAHGCLRGQAAAKGDKIRVRRQFCSTWVEGRDRITVPNQSWLVFSSLTFLLHVWGHSRAEGSKKRSKPTNCHILSVYSFISALTGRRSSPWWRAESWWSGTVLVGPTAAEQQKRRVSLLLCPPPTCSEQRHFKYLCLVVPAAVGDVPLYMRQTASVWVDSKKGGKKGEERDGSADSFGWIKGRDAIS